MARPSPPWPFVWKGTIQPYTLPLQSVYQRVSPVYIPLPTSDPCSYVSLCTNLICTKIFGIMRGHSGEDYANIIRFKWLSLSGFTFIKFYHQRSGSQDDFITQNTKILLSSLKQLIDITKRFKYVASVLSRYLLILWGSQYVCIVICEDPYLKSLRIPALELTANITLLKNTQFARNNPK